MATRCSPHIMIPKSTAKNRQLQARMNHVQPSATVRIKSYAINHKVHEDKLNGILCYRDNEGELICEGYDEGPRYSMPPSMPVNYHRRLEVPDFPPRRLREAPKDGESMLVPNGVAGKKLE